MTICANIAYQADEIATKVIESVQAKQEMGSSVPESCGNKAVEP